MAHIITGLCCLSSRLVVVHFHQAFTAPRGLLCALGALGVTPSGLPCGAPTREHITDMGDSAFGAVNTSTHPASGLASQEKVLHDGQCSRGRDALSMEDETALRRSLHPVKKEEEAHETLQDGLGALAGRFRARPGWVRRWSEA